MFSFWKFEKIFLLIFDDFYMEILLIFAKNSILLYQRPLNGVIFGTRPFLGTRSSNSVKFSSFEISLNFCLYAVPDYRPKICRTIGKFWNLTILADLDSSCPKTVMYHKLADLEVSGARKKIIWVSIVKICNFHFLRASGKDQGKIFFRNFVYRM